MTETPVRAETVRADTERGLRLALVDRVLAVLDAPHDDVDQLAADIREVLAAL